jgi:hypothetical protein
MSLPVFAGVLQVVAASDLIALFPRDLAERRAQIDGITVYAPPVTIPPPSLCMIWHRRHSRDAAHLWLRGIVRDLLALRNKYAKYSELSDVWVTIDDAALMYDPPSTGKAKAKKDKPAAGAPAA